MARRHRKGYYVDGRFVVAGSDADERLAQEARGEAPSRTELKNASEKLQDLGEELLELRPSRLQALSLPEPLHEAVLAAKRITSHGAMRRQRQYIGKLMRHLDEATLDAVREAMRIEHGQSAGDVLILHRAEQWRDELIADDERVAQWMSSFPATDSQHLRALIRQARKDAGDSIPSEARRHGRAYREIFALVRSELARAAKADTTG